MKTYARLLLVALLLSAPAGATAPRENIVIRTEWHVSPLSPDPITTELREEGGVVAIARLDPVEAFRPDVDLLSSEGRLMVPTGQLLVGLRSERPTGCEIYNEHRHRCFVDTDNDGTFDSVFAIVTRSSLLLVASGRIRPEAIPPVAYRRVDTRAESQSSNPPLRIDYVFSNRNGFMKTNFFNPMISGQGGGATLVPTLQILDGTYPRVENVFGIEVRIFETTERNLVRVVATPVASGVILRLER